jgi:hypothetical protein
MLNQICAHTTQQALARRAAEQRAREWPGLVESTLAALAGRVTRQDEMLASIDRRLVAVEATLGITES